VILAFDGPEAATIPRVGGFFSPREDAGAILAVTIASNRWSASAPDGTVLVRAIVGGARAPDLVETTNDDQLVLETLVSLDALVPLPEPKWAHVTRFVRSQVFPSVGHRSRVAEARARARALGSLHFVGACYDGGGIAGILARAEQTARELCS
jgi:oxygen-dependent protoporphyrinogen oxidase